MLTKYPGRIRGGLLMCKLLCVLSDALWSELSAVRQYTAHNDKAGYTHQVLKSETEKECVCVFV